MEAVSDGEMTNFRCVGCGMCWHIELGWVNRVDPATCPGCEHRAECMAASERRTVNRQTIDTSGNNLHDETQRGN